MRKPALALLTLTLIGLLPATAPGAEISADTETCLACHESVTPGIVSDWQNSRHAQVTPAAGLAKPELERRISVPKVADGLAAIVVGCAECHTANADKHPDTIDHNGFRIHTIVTPQDCAVCHPAEVDEYADNIMSQAHDNLNANPVYKDLVEHAIGTQSFTDGVLTVEAPDALTESDACNYCHGTRVAFLGTEERETSMGTMALPLYAGWPNQGVGRINPDGTEGACTSCHARHQFSIAVARKPATCGECHKGPDVPAYKVYQVSKHGNLYSSLRKEWDFGTVPWTVGEDFTAPTCAGCHAALVVTPDGEVLAERTHQFNDRLSWRIFGLPYAHPHPLEADTTGIKNSDGLPLPTTLAGGFASEFLIGTEEQAKRRAAMQKVCSGCHSTGWIDGHFVRFENTLATTNAKTLAATQILLDAYDKGLAAGLSDGDSLFNETLERRWVESWLFYANSIRFSSAMAGADYGVFANGRWWMNKNIGAMAEHLELLEASRPESE